MAMGGHVSVNTATSALPAVKKTLTGKKHNGKTLQDLDNHMPHDIVCLVAKVTDGMRRFAFCKQKKEGGTKIFACVFETFNAEHEAGRPQVPLFFGMTRPGIEPYPPALMARVQPIYTWSE